MLMGPLLHPDILRALASAGHGSKVLIADSNYPFATHAGPNAELVFLNLSPGKVNVTETLAVVAQTVPIESAEVMLPSDGNEPAIYGEFRAILGASISLETRSREEFYEIARSEDLCLVIATGEHRIYACIILTIGVLI
ncbi:MAG: RbsD or FucU transport [Chlorobia bacterium]|nr:RbsD or FucU transport [Fimbriimonadaceae bacterium]